MNTLLLLLSLLIIIVVSAFLYRSYKKIEYKNKQIESLVSDKRYYKSIGSTYKSNINNSAEENKKLKNDLKRLTFNYEKLNSEHKKLIKLHKESLLHAKCIIDESLTTKNTKIKIKTMCESFNNIYLGDNTFGYYDSSVN